MKVTLQGFAEKALTPLLFLFGSGIFLPLAFKGNPAFAPCYFFLHECYHAACHQLPERTFFIGGVPLFVCARCTGIYTGMLLTITINRFHKFHDIPIFLILLLCLPMFLDIARLNLHIAHYEKLPALLTGLSAGFAAGILYINFIRHITIRKNEK